VRGRPRAAGAGTKHGSRARQLLRQHSSMHAGTRKLLMVIPIALLLLSGCGSGVHPTNERRGASTYSSSTHSAGLRVPRAYRTDAEARTAVAKAVDQCKLGVRASAKISADARRELESACEDGFSAGEPTRAHFTSKSVCKELALLVPENARAEQRAFATCYAIASRE
jgi:hypothetical protein